MRIVLLLIILNFTFLSWAKANDISDFEIEGISIGDSLLNHFEKKELINGINKDYYSDYSVEPGKFLAISLYNHSKFKTYDGMQFTVKKNDKDFITHTVKGLVWYKKNINDCYKKMKEIDNEISYVFSNLFREEQNTNHAGDKSGKSKVKSFNYWFENDDIIEIDCYDWSDDITKERNWIDHLRIGGKTNEFNQWLIKNQY